MAPGAHGQHIECIRKHTRHKHTYLLGEELNHAVGEVETLLDDGGQLPDALALLAQHILGAGRTDDDFRAQGHHTDLHAGVPVLGQLTGEQLCVFGLIVGRGGRRMGGMNGGVDWMGCGQEATHRETERAARALANTQGYAPGCRACARVPVVWF